MNHISCVCVLIAFLFVDCSPNSRLKKEIFIVPKDYKGYCGVFHSDNYDPMDDTSEIREFNLDSTGIAFTKLRLNSSGVKKYYVRKTDSGRLDTLNIQLYPSDPLYQNSIHFEGTLATGNASNPERVIIFFFYVGIPSLDLGKEYFFFTKKLDSIAKIHFFKR